MANALGNACVCHQPSRPACAGASMIEVLVTLLILTLGLLGIASMQTYSLRQISNSEMRTHANLLVQELAEMIRVNAANAPEFATTVTVNQASDCPATRLQAWCQTLSRTLPGATITVGVASNTASITLSWPEKSMTQAGTSTTTLRYQVRVPT